MSIDNKLRAIADLIQQDPCQRGLERLFPVCADDFAQACHSLASVSSARLGVVTGFWIPGVEMAETDGPLGAVYLARTLDAMGIEVSILSDPFCRQAHEAGLRACHRLATTPLFDVGDELPTFSHLLAIERVGPNQAGQCRTMRDLDVTEFMRDAAALFEDPDAVTIGIGDGGNEIGMGKLPTALLHDCIPNGVSIACRVPTDYLVVTGISNWGAYALACGVAVARGFDPPADWFDVDLERHVLREMVERGPLVDGVLGRSEISVDGLAFENYVVPLIQMERIVRR